LGKKAKQIRSELVSKYGDVANLPTLLQIRTRSANMKTDKASTMSMKYLSDLVDFIGDYYVSSRDEYLAKGPTDLLILGKHHTDWIDDSSGRPLCSEGFVYSCKNLLDNMRRQYEGCGDQIAISMDTTFNLFTNGWCMYSCGCRNLIRDRSGKITQQYYIPFCFMVSRTERGDGYALILKCLAKVRLWQGLHSYVIKASCSDYHDGLVKAVLEQHPDGKCHDHIVSFVINIICNLQQLRPRYVGLTFA
jgi:hypothetical protein